MIANDDPFLSTVSGPALRWIVKVGKEFQTWTGRRVSIDVDYRGHGELVHNGSKV
jgi:hypothetical protein